MLSILPNLIPVRSHRELSTYYIVSILPHKHMTRMPGPLMDWMEESGIIAIGIIILL